MAAPLGFKTFVTGEVLTAADTNGYLMQGIWTFNNAAARDAAVTAPVEGNACYLKDTDVIQVYSGSAWVTKSGGSPLTTKGDLYGYSTADARIAVGANNTVLTADSTQATGVKWASAAPTSSNNRVNTQETTTSLTYTALTTAQSVTVTTGTKVMVIVSCAYTNGTLGNGAYASFAISGATTRSSSDTWANGTNEIPRALADIQSTYVSFQTVTAGSNTFTLQFRAVGAGTAYFRNREIIVVDLGS